MRTVATHRVGLALAAVLAGLLAPACSSSPDGGGGPGSTSGDAPAGDLGAVRMKLALPSGQNIEVVTWVLTGAGGASTVVQSGTVDSQSAGLSFLVSGVPAGAGYGITMSGTATDGSVVCTGSARFDVAARATTNVPVELACSVATSGSHVTLVNGTAFNCAATSGIAASPSETTVGHTVALGAMAVGPAPGALTYAWSAPSGSFSQPTGATTTFLCSTPGPVTVTLTVGDGPVPAGQSCSGSIDTATAVVTCDEAVADAGAPDSGPDGGPASPAPAIPPWGAPALAAALCAIGTLFTRPRRSEPSLER